MPMKPPSGCILNKWTPPRPVKAPPPPGCPGGGNSYMAPGPHSFRGEGRCACLRPFSMLTSLRHRGQSPSYSSFTSHAPILGPVAGPDTESRLRGAGRRRIDRRRACRGKVHGFNGGENTSTMHRELRRVARKCTRQAHCTIRHVHTHTKTAVWKKQ